METINLTHCKFDYSIYKKAKKKATVIKFIILILISLLCLILFGHRDNWFTDDSVFIFEDYLLYFLLTWGIFLSDFHYDRISKRCSCFKNYSETISNDVFVEEQLKTIKELQEDPMKLSNYIISTNIRIHCLETYIENINSTIDGLTNILK